MGWKGRRMGRKRSHSLASDFGHTRSNEDESGESRREGGGWHSLLFGSGIHATLLNPRQNHGSNYDQEEHTENGPTFNPEPERNPRIILGLYQGKTNLDSIQARSRSSLSGTIEGWVGCRDAIRTHEGLRHKISPEPDEVSQLLRLTQTALSVISRS